MLEPPPGFRLPLLPPLRDSAPTDVSIAKAIADRVTDNLVLVTGVVYEWTDKRWRELAPSVLERFIQDLDGLLVGPMGKETPLRLGAARVTSIARCLRTRIDRPDFFESPAEGINAANGLVVFDADGNPSLTRHQREHRHRHVLDVSWDPDDVPNSDLYAKLLTGAFGADPDEREKVRVLVEFLGAAMLGIGPRLKKPRALVLYGPSSENGKSQVLDMLRGMLPREAVAAIPIAAFGDERHVAGLEGKTLNAVDELGTAEVIASDVFKAVIAGGLVKGRHAHGKTRFVRPRAVHAFACNRLPPFRDGMDPAVQRRLLVLTFNRKVPEGERIKDLGLRIAAEERDALLFLGVAGASRLLQQGGFTEPPSSAAALVKWARDADAVIGFLNDPEWVEQDPEGFAGTKALYAAFKRWSREKGIPAVPPERVFAGRVAQTGITEKGSTGKQRGFRGVSLVHA